MLILDLLEEVFYSIFKIYFDFQTYCDLVLRDIAERGRDLEGILSQYERTVKPAFDKFVLPVCIFIFYLNFNSIV